MKIIISPAKKMREDRDGLSPESVPQFLEKTKEITHKMGELSDAELQKLWKCNDKLAELNINRVRNFQLEKNLSPALFAYEGIQYQNLGVNALETKHLDYLKEHLRIVSGLYGLLRPFDGVVLYRLEMQGKLAVGDGKNLYEFWGDSLAKELEGEPLLNLASLEYSKAITGHLSAETPCYGCTFGELKGEKVAERGTLCKMARGQMLRWMAIHQVKEISEIKNFKELDFCLDENRSTEFQYVFMKK